MIHGVLPVLLTPFDADLAIDVRALRSEIDWVLTHGVDGLVMGMVSETFRLSSQERDGLVDSICRHTAGRVPVIASTGAESTRVAVAHARSAQTSGASAVMAIPPVSVSLSDDEVYAYYAAMVEALDIPVIVQDASGYLGHGLSIGMQARLFTEFGDRVHFKPESQPIGPKLSALRDATGGDALIFEGTGGIALVDSHARGIAGTMPGSDIIWAIVALWRALRDGDQDVIDALNGPISTLVLIQSSLDAYIAIQKHLLVRQGVIDDVFARGPVAYRLDAESEREVDRLFDHLVSVMARREVGAAGQ
ncbi:dihydrodipicolinate synthase family protein [Herbiconiux sp. KACC 21604]|uniref:dihydrodipicolinate synthase family protein n=1 Tax=unclassified Herbiconiux TaxID=2618217 RepID=UPI0014913294|nr:dihydrodipicolinate synthase family protein [Herbiconiux sp. SALV-R1]QJU55287.1 dihydrodipicolinate synthase family protein [Herbiconiux sp. SALV-R1]WPO86454.1 dihydrodipicolinate synthase family protein [Herbiconiux sp. KACC 21604]